jgi:tol-pal system protein YbgF
MTIVRRTLQGAALAAVFALGAGGAMAQSSPGLFDNLFNRGDSNAERNEAQAASDLQVQVDQLRAQLRQATGQIEQLQFQNRQLQEQLSRYQGGMSAAPGAQASAPPMQSQSVGAPPLQSPAAPPLQTAVASRNPAALPPPPAETSGGRRSDAFDPSQHPNAPGVPRALGGTAAVIPQDTAAMPASAPAALPGTREPGAPLDLSSLSTSPQMPDSGAALPPAGNGTLPAPPPRNVSAIGQQLATLPPSNSPADEFELAQGYVRHKDYALAENAFRDFLRRYPKDKLVPDANYWLGESLFQRQRYQDAADAYLVVVRNYERSDKAPDALLRLGQSLAALGQKEMACASLGEVNRKYPRAASSVKRTVAAEQKRVHC